MSVFASVTSPEQFLQVFEKICDDFLKNVNTKDGEKVENDFDFSIFKMIKC